MAATVKSRSLSGNQRVFAGRGALAVVFAASLFVTLAVSPPNGICVLAAFSIVDGALAFVAGHLARRNWINPRRSVLFAEGFVEIAFGIFIALGGHAASIIAFAVATNAIIAGGAASMYSFGDKDYRSANWWALYGITGVILGFIVIGLSVVGLPAILIAVGIVALVQGSARLFLYGGR
jgi:uncharacterized membrane protein HdeD (DUF308 family)